MKTRLGQRQAAVSANWQVVDAFLGAEFRTLEGIAINEASGTLDVAFQESADRVTWATVAGSAITVVQTGQETFSVTFSEANVRVIARGQGGAQVDGQIRINYFADPLACEYGGQQSPTPDDCLTTCEVNCQTGCETATET